MTFDTNHYLSWYVPRIHAGDGAINLHASGVASLDPRDYPPAAGDPWTAAGRFESALAAWLGVPASEVIFTPGGTGGTLLALMTLLGAGRQCVVESPIYEPMLRQAERLGPVTRVARRPEDSFGLDLEAFERALAHDAGLVLITEPHNPSGRFSARRDVLDLADVARRRGAVLLVNEVYRGFSDQPTYHGAAHNVVVVSSLSKLVGAYWARLGWIGAAPDVVERLRSAHRSIGMPSSPGAEVGSAIMERAETLRTAAAALAHKGHATVAAWVDSCSAVGWVPPQGPGFGSVTLPAGTDDVAFAERLHEEHGVLTVPGTFFEMPGTLRLAWLQAGARLDEGLDRLGRLLTRGGR
jgi:hypothetical protein